MRRSALLLAFVSFACDGAPEGTPQDPTSTPEPTTTAPIETPTTPEVETPSTPELEPTPLWDDTPTFLVSRFAPTRGLTGTRIQILTAFDPSGCVALGECRVTIGDHEAQIAEDQYILEVVVPRMVETGRLCVTWRDRTECGDTFEVIEAPVIHDVQPLQVKAGSGDVMLSFTGEGFVDEATVFANWVWLDPNVTGPSTLTVVIPAEQLASPGTLSLSVFAPHVGRCGAKSDPVELLITP